MIALYNERKPLRLLIRNLGYESLMPPIKTTALKIKLKLKKENPIWANILLKQKT